LWYNGEHYWIFISGATGFLVGLVRWTFDYPSNLPGIFKEIQTYHVDPKWVCVTYLCSALSLAGGATLGPEQALVRNISFVSSYIYGVLSFLG
jgi:H+/Cl- antiporter ClcA